MDAVKGASEHTTGALVDRVTEACHAASFLGGGPVLVHENVVHQQSDRFRCMQLSFWCWC